MWKAVTECTSVDWTVEKGEGEDENSLGEGGGRGGPALRQREQNYHYLEAVLRSEQLRYIVAGTAAPFGPLLSNCLQGFA